MLEKIPLFHSTETDCVVEYSTVVVSYFFHPVAGFIVKGGDAVDWAIYRKSLRQMEVLFSKSEKDYTSDSEATNSSVRNDDDKSV